MCRGYEEQAEIRLVSRSLRHYHFVAETAGSDDQKKRADNAECEAVGPEMADARSPKDDASSDVDEIRRRN